jgi:AraC-like DNA-binding protein
MLDDTLLSDVDVAVHWAQRREWQPGDRLTNWSAGAGALGFYVVFDGTVEVDIAGNSWRLRPNDIFLVPPRLQRDRIETPHGATWLTLGILPRLHGRLSLMDLLPSPFLWRVSPALYPRLIGWFEGIIEAFEDSPDNINPSIARTRRPRSRADRLIAEGLAKAIFGLCWRELRPQSSATVTSLDIPLWLLETLQRVRQSPDQPLPGLCQAAGVSPAHMRRMFHRYLGQSPQVYITEVRLQTARLLLETTDRTVAAIAAEVGFDSLSHFTQLFAHRYHTPPARYRQLRRSEGG